MLFLIYGLVGGLVLTMLGKKLVKNTWLAAIVGAIIANVALLLVGGQIDNYFLIGSIVGAGAIALMPQSKK